MRRIRELECKEGGRAAAYPLVKFMTTLIERIHTNVIGIRPHAIFATYHNTDVLYQRRYENNLFKPVMHMFIDANLGYLIYV